MGNIKTAVTKYKGIDITIALVSGKCTVDNGDELKGEYPDLAAAEKAIRTYLDPDGAEAKESGVKSHPLTKVLVCSWSTNGQFQEATTRFTEKHERYSGRKYYWVKYTSKLRDSWRKSKEAVSSEYIFLDTPENRATLTDMRARTKEADEFKNSKERENLAAYKTLTRAAAPTV